jgi:hypothetical protein
MYNCHKSLSVLQVEIEWPPQANTTPYLSEILKSIHHRCNHVLVGLNLSPIHQPTGIIVQWSNPEVETMLGLLITSTRGFGKGNLGRTTNSNKKIVQQDKT